MISRVEELERRAEWLAARLVALEGSLAAALDRINQLGGMGGIIASASQLVFGRAVGAITARSGTTLGSGTFNFADADGGTLVEGTESAACGNIVDKEIADNAWLLLAPTQDGWVVVATGAPCDDLS